MRVPIIVACAAAAAVASPLYAATYHIAPDGSGDFPTIQAAIDAASSGDEIVLSDGTFTGDGNWDLDFGTKELVLLSQNGYEMTAIDCGFDGIHDIRHRGVILEGGQTAATVIEGITFEKIQGPMDGGAIRCVGASPTLRTLRTRDNRFHGRGGGVFAQAASPTIEECVFLGGLDNGEGNAIFGEQSSVSVNDCFFDINGWGIVDIDGGTLTDCVFDGVRGPNSNLGLCVRVWRGSVAIFRCEFRNNFGSSVGVSYPGEATVGDCLFEDNIDDSGAGISAFGNTTIHNTTFRDNYAAFGGAAVNAGSGSGHDVAVTADHCVFQNNQGQAWIAIGSAVEGNGPRLSLALTHCTFVGNASTTDGSGSIGIQNGASLTVDHTIIAFSGQPAAPHGAVYCDGPPGSLVVTCSDFYGNEGGDWTGCVAGMETTAGNLSADPLFCDVADGDLSLQADSPCAPASTGECGLIGAIGPWCGPLAVEPRSWGSIKALYR